MKYLKDYNNNNNNTNTFVAFLYASKAFDKHKYNIVFHRLKYNNFTSYINQLIYFFNY